MIDLEQVIEKAENIYNFYLDSNWEFRFIEYKYKHFRLHSNWQAPQTLSEGAHECGEFTEYEKG